MRNVLIIFFMCVCNYMFSQELIEFNVRYNFQECRYEVYYKPDFTRPTFNMNTTQCVIVAEATEFPGLQGSDFTIIQTLPGGNYAINSVTNDSSTGDLFVPVASVGFPITPWNSGEEKLMFAFTLDYSNPNATICQEGIRLHITGTDNQNPGNNGDYNNSVQDGDNTNTEMYKQNYDSGTTVVSDNTVDVSVTCVSNLLILNATTTFNGCESVTYSWSGPNGFTSTTEDPVVVDPAAGTYTVEITDGNGCTAEKSVDVNATNCSILPVELTSFDVEKSDETSLVSWSTASEINNDYFNVERSKDGVRFETIGTVQGNGTTTDRITYSFEDENPMGGVNYYRLKQVDYDGAYEYSDIKNVRFDSRMSTNVTMGLYPNPANDYVSIELDGIQLDSKTMVRVFDKIGKLVLVQDIDASNQLNISELADGMYMIQAVNNDSVIATKKLVKTSSF